MHTPVLCDARYWPSGSLPSPPPPNEEKLSPHSKHYTRICVLTLSAPFEERCVTYFLLEVALAMILSLFVRRYKNFEIGYTNDLCQAGSTTIAE